MAGDIPLSLTFHCGENRDAVYEIIDYVLLGEPGEAVWASL